MIFLFIILQMCAIYGTVKPTNMIPYIEVKDITTRSASVIFSCTDCWKFDEQISSVKVLCLSKWCSTKPTITNYTSYEKYIFKISNLSPFTFYRVNVLYMHSTEFRDFKTKPAIPKHVRELEAYSKNENSISLRWKPPYPPTGELQLYEISYVIDDDGSFISEEIRNVSITPCELWPDCHCLTLLNLKSNRKYSITLRAGNKQPQLFGRAETISVITQKEPSEAPYNLDAKWTENKGLSLTWNHPNKTNGDIEYFIIMLIADKVKHNGNKKSFYKFVNKYIYSPQYTYEIKDKELMNSTWYKIIITAFNGLYGKEASMSIIGYDAEDNRQEPPSDNADNTTYFQNHNNIIQDAKYFKRTDLINSLILLLMIIPTCFLFLWLIKKSSWNNKSACKNVFCISNDDSNVPREETLLTNIRRGSSEINPNISTDQVQESQYDTALFMYEKTFSNPIEFDKFKKYLDTSKMNGDLEREFTRFEKKVFKVLYETADQQLCEYIDLVYLDGTRIPKAYVATEIPKVDDIERFWQQIWEDNVELIVLLGENGSEEDEYQPYWPEKNEQFKCEDITVQQFYNKSYTTYYYTIRKFTLIVEDLIKQVVQIHFSYCGSNPRKFEPFFKKIQELQLKTTSSILVHSSTGIREVGFVLLCAISLRLAVKERIIDVLRNMDMLRKYKPEFTPNVAQYQMVHSVISHVLFD